MGDRVTLEYVHGQPCNCTNCEWVRLKAFHGPGVYKSIGVKWDPPTSGTTTWTLDAFLRGKAVPIG